MLKETIDSRRFFMSSKLLRFSKAEVVEREAEVTSGAFQRMFGQSGAVKFF